MKNNLFPLQQGALDWMCSIYAAINVMYIRGKIATLDEAAIPFRRAIDFMKSKEDWDLAKAISEGIDEEDCSELFENLSGTDWDIYANNKCSDRFIKLKQLLDEGSAPVIASLVCDAKGARDVIHYTVITDVGASHLTNFDSQEKKIEKSGNNLRYDGRDVRLGCFWVMQSE